MWALTLNLVWGVLSLSEEMHKSVHIENNTEETEKEFSKDITFSANFFNERC